MSGPGKFEIAWLDRGGPPQNRPDPRYPDGQDIDITVYARQPACSTPLPYPTGKGVIGCWAVKCLTCGLTVLITAASRPDDPRSVKLPCKELPER